ncbi:MAG: D-2-hydroxyacid dehydrogenase [Myxococcota bacterium]
MRGWLALLLVFGCLLSTPKSSAGEPPPKVVVMYASPEGLQRLREAAPDVRLVGVSDPEAALAEIGDADGLIGVPTDAMIQAGTRLRWVQVFSAGVERYLFDSLRTSDIVMTNAKVIQGPNVADQAMALLLVLTRGLHATLRHRGDWEESRKAGREYGPIELHGKTALVLGLGGIGTEIARRAAGFGMRVIATAAHPDKPHPAFVDAVYGPGEMSAQLPKADVVFVALPLVDETRGLLDAEAFAAFKPGAFLVNIARGKIVDTDALIAALESGQVAGAGLDVTDPEPLPDDHPLWTRNDVVITPHMGGSSDQVAARRAALFEHNLQQFAKGGELRNVVDKTRGY